MYRRWATCTCIPFTVKQSYTVITVLQELQFFREYLEFFKESNPAPRDVLKSRGDAEYFNIKENENKS